MTYVLLNVFFVGVCAFLKQHLLTYQYYMHFWEGCVYPSWAHMMNHLVTLQQTVGSSMHPCIGNTTHQQIIA